MWITDYEERGRWGLMKGKGWNKGKIEERKDKIDRFGKKERCKMKGIRWKKPGMKKRERSKNWWGRSSWDERIDKGKIWKGKNTKKSHKGKSHKKKKPQRKKQSFVAFIICACFYKNLNL